MRALAVFGVWLLAFGFAPQQSRDAQLRPSRTGSATIAGRVVGSDDGRPLKRVRLALSDADGALAGGRITVTDDNGQFAFRQLPTGRFLLAATKPAYLVM